MRGSIDQAGRRSTFSNCNNDVEIAAPGEDIWSTFPGNGYGVMYNQDRCWTDANQTKWPDGKCFVPESKTQRIGLPGFQGGANFGCDATFRAGAQAAAQAAPSACVAAGDFVSVVFFIVIANKSLDGTLFDGYIVPHVVAFTTK